MAAITNALQYDNKNSIQVVNVCSHHTTKNEETIRCSRLLPLSSIGGQCLLKVFNLNGWFQHLSWVTPVCLTNIGVYFHSFMQLSFNSAQQYFGASCIISEKRCCPEGPHKALPILHACTLFASLVDDLHHWFFFFWSTNLIQPLGTS